MITVALLAAAWISDGKPVLQGAAAYGDDPAPVMRRAFEVAAPGEAELAIASLGYYVVEVNGTRLSATSLMPLWTVVDRTIHEDAYPVGHLLRQGANEVRVTLGNGWRNPLPMLMFGRFNFREHLGCGRPSFRLSVRGADGKALVESDASWEFAETGILRNNVYLGSTVDARVKPASWRPVAVVQEPAGEVVRRTAPAIRPRDRSVAGAGRMLPRAWYDFWSERRQIVDFGRNGSGVPTFSLGKGRRGQRIEFRYGELLNPDGTLNPNTAVFGQLKWGGGGEGAPAVAQPVDVYVRSGDGDEAFTPPFTFHAFRYAEITGLDEPLPAGAATSEVHCSDLVSLVEFECSNPDLNRLHEVCRRTFVSNLVGVQSDCPGRERLGYGGDIVATADTLALNFDMRGFYLKTLRDFADERARHGGWYPETAPYVGIADRGFGGASGSISWTLAVPVMADVLLRHYGDRRGLEYFGDMIDYVRMVDAKCPDGIVPTCIGDHETLDRNDESNSDTATACYHEFVRLVEKFASVLGKDAERREMSKLREKVFTAFNAKFVKDGRVGRGTQGAQAIALDFGLIPPGQTAAAEKILLDDIASRGCALTTGIFGTRALLRHLSRSGHLDVAALLVLRRDFPGWLHMLDRGATTLWETWKEETLIFSHDHPMFGSVDGWIIETVLGVQVGEDGRVTVDPKPVLGVEWARGSFRMPDGSVRRIEWGKPR